MADLASYSGLLGPPPLNFRRELLLIQIEFSKKEIEAKSALVCLTSYRSLFFHLSLSGEVIRCDCFSYEPIIRYRWRVLYRVSLDGLLDFRHIRLWSPGLTKFSMILNVPPIACLSMSSTSTQHCRLASS